MSYLRSTLSLDVPQNHTIWSGEFIPNYDTKSFLHDVLRGAIYPFTLGFMKQYLTYVAIAVAILSYGYRAVLKYADPVDDKRRAWTLSVISSAVLSACCTPISIYWLYLLIRRGQSAAGNFIITGGDLEDFLMIFFYVFMWMDIVVSYFRYPGHMELCTGYIHHTVYLILVGNALKWRYTKGLAAMFCEEIPTFILGLGFLNPTYKSEKFFGYTFFVLRIVYHAFVTIIATKEIRHHTFYWVAGYLALAIHLWWFSGWIRRQIRLRHMREMADEDSLIALISAQTRQQVMQTSRLFWESSSKMPLRLDTMLSLNEPGNGKLARVQGTTIVESPPII